MAWTPFSAEAIRLHALIVHSDPTRPTKAIEAIEAALENAHRNGPSNETCAEFDAKENARLDAEEAANV